jgi:HD-GYP domain-containing protein (c-di-GMP phosphodiesterase class II)
LKHTPAPSLVKLFKGIVNALTELAFRTSELHNFYETVHPRAVALSTMHSVHRLVRQSLSMSELLPRVARLAAQIVKAESCTIYLMDGEKKNLIPSITVGDEKPPKGKIPLGRGIEGRAAETGDFILQRNLIGVPLIKDDVAGVMILKNKKDNMPFTRVDLEILKTLSEQAVLAIKNAELLEESEKLTEGSIKSINDMLELNQRSQNVNMPFFKTMVRALARDLNLPPAEQDHAEQAASLLDVGNAGISEKILTKPGKLTQQEFDQIKRHPSISVQILSSIHSLQPILPLILTHHERYDGKGYPEGLKGEEIPLGARIIAVVDAFSAMTSKRPYRKSLTPLEALREIEQASGTQFDPTVVKSFIKLMRKHKEWRNV